MKTPLNFIVVALFSLFLSLLINHCHAANRFWISTVAGNWNAPANWSATSGGAGGASVPGVADVAIFDGAGGRNGNCNLTAAANVGGVVISGYTGTLDIKGFVLTISGAALASTFSTGIVTNTGGVASVTFSAASAATFNGSTLTANLTGTVLTLLFSGSTFNGTVTISKTGATNDSGSGGNTFNGATSLTNSGSGQLILGNVLPDTFNSTLSLSNSGTSGIYISQSATGTNFNGNVTVNSSNGLGIFFGQNFGSSTLATGKTVSVGAFTVGTLSLKFFTQSGATAQTLTLTSSAALIIGPSSTFNGAITISTPSIFLNGGTFNSTASVTKTGSSNDSGVGGNVFFGATTFTNSGSGKWINAASNYDLFGATLTISNTGLSGIYLSEGVTGFPNSYTNVIVNSTNGLGIFFGNSGGLSSIGVGSTISIGGSGFSAGELRLLGFQVQFGSVNVTLTGSASLRIGTNSTFNGLSVWTAPSVYLDGATFFAFATFVKTGSSNDASVGGNNFQAGSTITNSGTGTITLSNVTGDLNHWFANYNQSPGVIQPAFNGTTIYQGDITVNSTVPIIFGAGAGIVSMQHTSSQSFNNTGTATPTITRLVMNTSSGASITLNTPVNVTSTATFTSGVIFSSSSNYLNIANGATVSGASNSSYVDGPVRKTGNQAFTYPVGNGGIYRPITITAPSLVTDAFTGQFVHAAQTYGNQSTYLLPILTVSSCEYWVLDRTVGTSNVSVTLYWNSPDCTGTYITDLTKLVVGRWNGTNWVSQGNGGTTGTTTNGTIVSSGVVTSFSPFAVASSSLANPLPIKLTSFTAQLQEGVEKLSWETSSEIDNDYFSVERSSDGYSFTLLSKIHSQNMGSSAVAANYSYDDEQPLPGISYYRLKQTSTDKKETVLAVRAVENSGTGYQFVAFPNPVSNQDTVTTNYDGAMWLIDQTGKTILEIEQGRKFTVGAVTPGSYILRTGNGQTQRIIIR